jgi:hypothetical protein
VGSGGFAFHEHHEEKEAKEEDEEAHGKKKHHLFGYINICVYYII